MCGAHQEPPQTGVRCAQSRDQPHLLPLEPLPHPATHAALASAYDPTAPRLHKYYHKPCPPPFASRLCSLVYPRVSMTQRVPRAHLIAPSTASSRSISASVL